MSVTLASRATCKWIRIQHKNRMRYRAAHVPHHVCMYMYTCAGFGTAGFQGTHAAFARLARTLGASGDAETAVTAAPAHGTKMPPEGAHQQACAPPIPVLAALPPPLRESGRRGARSRRPPRRHRQPAAGSFVTPFATAPAAWVGIASDTRGGHAATWRGNSCGASMHGCAPDETRAGRRAGAEQQSVEHGIGRGRVSDTGSRTAAYQAAGERGAHQSLTCLCPSS